ncbi:MAG: hypothetical protein KDI19_15910, partial [Pseudomonadales bacterium]|nr:hypothetical protein [Pseudomonadales bacterium]
PLYYYPYADDYAFDNTHFFGVTTAFVLGWHSRIVHVYGIDYAHHPYHGRHYVSRFYVRHVRERDHHRYADHVWRPKAHEYRSRQARHERQDRHERQERHERRDASDTAFRSHNEPSRDQKARSRGDWRASSASQHSERRSTSTRTVQSYSTQPSRVSAPRREHTVRQGPSRDDSSSMRRREAPAPAVASKEKSDDHKRGRVQQQDARPDQSPDKALGSRARERIRRLR